MIRLALVDDHPIVREGLELVLGRQADIEVVASLPDAASLHRHLQQVPTDVVLLDMELPDGPALNFLSEFVKHTRVVVFTAYEKPTQVAQAMRDGASGFLLKGAASEELLSAIRAAAAGEMYLQPRLAASVLSQPTLSPREREVLKLLVEGRSNQDIGTALSVTERTVKFHVNSILTKLQVNNRTEAVKVALEGGFV